MNNNERKWNNNIRRKEIIYEIMRMKEWKYTAAWEIAMKIWRKKMKEK